MSTKKVHGFVRVLGGVFLTPCGRYLDGPDKERIETDPGKVTCRNCQRTDEHRHQELTARWQRS